MTAASTRSPRSCRRARRDYLGCRVVRQPIAYPVFHRDVRGPTASGSRPRTGVDRLVSIGRNGEFAHILMEDVYWRTVRRARRLAAELKSAISRRGLTRRTQRARGGYS